MASRISSSSVSIRARALSSSARVSASPNRASICSTRASITTTDSRPLPHRGSALLRAVAHIRVIDNPERALSAKGARLLVAIGAGLGQLALEALDASARVHQLL